MTDTDAPVDLHLATYSDEGAAQQDWDAIKQLARDGVIVVDGLALVSRDEDGNIDVKDNAHDVGRGATLGAVGGGVIGLIFPLVFLASAVVGAGIGSSASGRSFASTTMKRRRSGKTSKTSCRPVSSAIVAPFEESSGRQRRTVLHPGRR